MRTRSVLLALGVALVATTSTACVTDDPLDDGGAVTLAAAPPLIDEASIPVDEPAALDGPAPDESALALVAAAAPAPVQAIARPNYATSGPFVAGFCWNRFVGYGNGFWINTTLRNGDGAAHTASWEVRRNGVLIDSRAAVAYPGATIALPTASMSSYYNDTLTFRIDGSRSATTTSRPARSSTTCSTATSCRRATPPSTPR